MFAAQHYASQLVLANNQRRGSVLPRSHKDTARKAFERVTKNVLPGSYAQLQRALKAEARTYESKVDELDTRVREDRAAAAAQTSDDDVARDAQAADADVELDDDLELEDDGD